jgi:hypothetical protein
MSRVDRKPRVPFKNWPQAMEARLIDLCSNSELSYREIALKLNAEFPKERKVTRNAVLGKASRDGLRDGKPKNAASRGGPKVRVAAKGYRHAKRRTRPGTGLAPVLFGAGESAMLRSEGDPGRSRPYSRRLSEGSVALAERKAGNLPCIVEAQPLTSMARIDTDRSCCQWPTSLDVACMEVCGSEVKIGAYCERHAAVAYRTMPTAKRNRVYQKTDEEYRHRLGRHPMAEALD